MSTLGFNRERAQRILEAGWLADQSDFTGDTDDLLDLLADCVVNAPDHTVEGRDWIGNPDGTLAYWQAEAEDARAKLAVLEAIHCQGGVTAAGYPQGWLPAGLVPAGSPPMALPHDPGRRPAATSDELVTLQEKPVDEEADWQIVSGWLVEIVDGEPEPLVEIAKLPGYEQWINSLDAERSIAGDTPWDDAVARLQTRRAASDRALAPLISMFRARIAVAESRAARSLTKPRVLIDIGRLAMLLDALDPKTRP